jgi:hypothetical protein
VIYVINTEKEMQMPIQLTAYHPGPNRWFDYLTLNHDSTYTCDVCQEIVANPIQDSTVAIVQFLQERQTIARVYSHCLPPNVTGDLCDFCGDYTLHWQATRLETGSYSTLCMDCIANPDFHNCVDCDAWYEEGYHHYCEYDEEEEPEDTRIIHNWDYHPTPIFHGISKLQFGIELEMDLTNISTHRTSLDNMHAEDEYEQHFYFKNDGSLHTYGVELVTHPRDLGEWHTYADKFGAMLQSTSANGGRAWTRDECGLHIHVSRDGFSSLAHITRFAMFFARNQRGWTKLANRESNYATWANLRDGEVITKVKFPHQASHYDAVSLAPANTIEVRIFRPSLAIGRIIGSIELVAATIEYTRERSGSITNLFRWENFETYVNASNYKYARHIMQGGKFTPERKVAWSIHKEGN